MSGNFLRRLERIADGRIAGMTKRPLDEVLLPALFELLCIIANEAPSAPLRDHPPAHA